MDEFGLLGRNIAYSFSRAYFKEKFSREQVAATYQNFDLEHISLLPEVLENHPRLKGFNVTIPYKEAVISFLDELDPDAAEIGAVNTVKILQDRKLKGFNTDHLGFSEAIRPYLNPDHRKALILGTGGASRAVIHALQVLGISPVQVSRRPADHMLSYRELSSEVMAEHQVLVNCTPLGTFPGTEAYPPVPIEHLSSRHLVFDLVYNPPETRLMKLAAEKGAQVSNGQRMLELQAEAAWRIWNRS